MQRMAVVAQLVERWLVVPDVAGSSPVGRPRTHTPVLRTANNSTPSADADLESEVVVAPDVPWVTIVWNDPVNLMSYVTYVFRGYFGFPKAEAERLMLLVHHEGRAVVATGPREEMERHTEAMHEYGLWATVAKASDG
jgi:ATP-dependent Clp protease adaptor protein ClpS